MNKIIPNTIKHLFLIYTVDLAVQTGLTDLTVEVKDISNNVILLPMYKSNIWMNIK